MVKKIDLHDGSIWNRLFSFDVSDDFVDLIIDGIAPSWVRCDDLARMQIRQMYKAAINVRKEEFFNLQANYRVYSCHLLDEHLRATKHPACRYAITSNYTAGILRNIYNEQKADSLALKASIQKKQLQWDRAGRKIRQKMGKRPKLPDNMFCIKYPTLALFAEDNLKQIANALNPFQFDCCCWVFQWLMEYILQLKTEYMLNAPEFFTEKLNDMTRMYFHNKELQFWREFLEDQRDAAEAKSRSMLTELVEHRGWTWNDIWSTYNGGMFAPHNHSRRAIGLWTPREDFEQKLYVLLSDGVQAYFKTRDKAEKMDKIHKEASLA